MQNINSSEGLKTAIMQLESEHELQGRLLKRQLYFTYESLKPVNLLRKTLLDMSESPDLINGILSTAFGLAGGYLSGKVFIGAKGNLIKKILGLMLQFGITTAVVHNSSATNSLGHAIVRYLRRKKESGKSDYAE